MKKIGVIIVLALFAFSIGFTSCRKEYTCTDCVNGETKVVKSVDRDAALIKCLAEDCASVE